MTLHPDIMGIDISRHHLDIHDVEAGTTGRIANTGAAIADWVERLAPRSCLPVMEATGRGAKTDTIDACMFAELGRRLAPSRLARRRPQTQP
jgi:transposase